MTTLVKNWLYSLFNICASVSAEIRGIVDSISKCPQNIQKELFENIILSGGVSLLNGLSERICNEINNRVSPSTNIRIIAGPDSKYGAWIGGSIIGSTPSLKSLFVTHDEYNDVGPGISHQFFQ